MSHPAKFTPTIVAALEAILAEYHLPVHDPFAGTGERLGALCDRVGVPFTGTEIEPEFIVDPRVQPGDSTLPLTYPGDPYMVVTSPVYPNGMTDHFEAKDGSARHTYRQGLAKITGEDRPLHTNNMGRYGNRHRRSDRVERAHYDIAARCVRWWPSDVVVNVKDVVATRYRSHVIDAWTHLLTLHDYVILREFEVATPGQRHGANGTLRAEHEVILVAHHEP